MSKRVIAAGVAGLIALGVALGVVLSQQSVKYVTAYFSRATGLYAGSNVDVLGVPVGKIQSVTPEGTRVKVVMSYDANDKLPARTDAVIIPPSVVADRYIQLTPAYHGGPTLPNNAVIPQTRTAVPLELDQIYAQMNRLNVALGPQGANKHGAFSRLINVSAANLAGNGKAFNSMLQNFSDFIATLGANRNNFFQTVVNLQQFTTTMARDDGGVRRLAGDLATVSSFLDGERSDLAAAMHNLSISLGLVAQFVHHNAAALTGDIHGIASVTTGLLREKRALIEVLDQAPLALQNLAETFYPGQHHDLRTKGNQVNGNSGPCAPGGLLYAVLTSLGYACPSSSSAVPGLPSHSSAGSRRSGLGQVLGAGL